MASDSWDLDSIIKVFKWATKEEKQQLLPNLGKKAASTLKDAPPTARPEIAKKLQEIDKIMRVQPSEDKGRVQQVGLFSDPARGVLSPHLFAPILMRY